MLGVDPEIVFDRLTALNWSVWDLKDGNQIIFEQDQQTDTANSIAILKDKLSKVLDGLYVTVIIRSGKRSELAAGNPKNKSVEYLVKLERNNKVATSGSVTQSQQNNFYDTILQLTLANQKQTFDYQIAELNRKIDEGKKKDAPDPMLVEGFSILKEVYKHEYLIPKQNSLGIANNPQINGTPLTDDEKKKQSDDLRQVLAELKKGDPDWLNSLKSLARACTEVNAQYMSQMEIIKKTFPPK